MTHQDGVLLKHLRLCQVVYLAGIAGAPMVGRHGSPCLVDFTPRLIGLDWRNLKLSLARYWGSSNLLSRRLSRLRRKLEVS